MKKLLEQIQTDGLTKVTVERFECIDKISLEVANLEGDIIECGVWKGGMGIYLSKTFPNKTIWLADSFEGFQPPEQGKYSFSQERHLAGKMAAPLSDFKKVLEQYQVNLDHIRILKGFVKETLPTAGIEKIALLRIDVDAYSATREVLDELYHKVVKGGYIIFDDTCLVETRAAILDFFGNSKGGVNLLHTVTGEPVTLFNPEQSLPCGCYIKK
jgi:O-methyltransferase